MGMPFKEKGYRTLDFRKEFFVSSILPKNERKISAPVG
jgi:hypothetical protein